MNNINFATAFQSLTGHTPFPWQTDLHARFTRGEFPSTCMLPTGLGKTSVIPIWLCALAQNPNDVPRRLVYIVNRRTVVDQATAETERMRENLHKDPSLDEALRALCPHRSAEIPLAISTLRGQFADNREWCSDPARPAVILGTVDMIGSRLLFSGYGIGFKSKPLHAAFLGQDSLLVHDEAHLEQPFQELIVSIRQEQERFRDLKPLRTIELTATPRNNDYFTLLDEDHQTPAIQQRIHAKKSLELHSEADEKKIPPRIAEIALEHRDSHRAILIFARSVEAVEEIADRLSKEKQKYETLTGTIRGKERDRLVKTPVFKRFLRDADHNDETVYLVCTSAGEVGVNISADHLVCDLSTLDSMIQRFGRVNRFGERDDTRIDVVHPADFPIKKAKENDKKKEKEKANAKNIDQEVRIPNTLEVLKALEGDASPHALTQIDKKSREDSFASTPVIFPATDILFDAWSLTSIRDRLPGRPHVEPYLHGEKIWEPPVTQIAWREEVALIDEDLRLRNDPRDLLEDYPLKPHEILRDRSDRIFKRLQSLAGKYPDKKAWLIDDDGSVEVIALAELADKDQKSRIESKTVLLPPQVGGLKKGMFTGKPDDPADDVSDWVDDDNIPKRRVRLWDVEEAPKGMRLILSIDIKPNADESDESTEEPIDSAQGEDETESVKMSRKGRIWSWFARPDFADDDGSKTAIHAVAWEVHTADVVEHAQKFVACLHLGDMEREAIVFAAKAHDLGKKRVVWQRGIGNPNPTHWLAKSSARMRPIDITPYRHELGSIVDLIDDYEYEKLSDEMRTLVLHLIAAHHGYARPHFPEEYAFDPVPRGKDPRKIAFDSPHRFADLQKKYGRWGLAYLESILRAADHHASAHPSQTIKEQS